MTLVDPAVDVTIAVHTRTRPIARAVRSVLDGTVAPVRVTVVAHRIDPGIIRDNLGALADDPRVRLLALDDGIPSPAGPLNLGLAESTAPFLSVMGSDDEFEPGAIDAWLALQRATGADAVLARIVHDDGRVESSPAARPGRRGGLDAVRDRLAYRAAPLGLVSRAAFGDERFAVGLPSGEDVPYVVRVWFSGRPIAFARTGPGYRVNHDADDRVTAAPRPVSGDFAFLDVLEADPLVQGLDRREREALGVKLMRANVADAVLNRRGRAWSVDDRVALAGVVARILVLAPEALRLLSAADHRLIDLVRDPAAPDAALDAAVVARGRYRSVAALVPRNPLLAAHRQGPFRTLAAAALVR